MSAARILQPRSPHTAVQVTYTADMPISPANCWILPARTVRSRRCLSQNLLWTTAGQSSTAWLRPVSGSCTSKYLLNELLYKTLVWPSSGRGTGLCQQAVRLEISNHQRADKRHCTVFGIQQYIPTLRAPSLASQRFALTSTSVSRYCPSAEIDARLLLISRNNA